MIILNYLYFSDGKKVMVGIYRTDVDEPFLEWHNGGIHWPGINTPPVIILKIYRGDLLKCVLMLMTSTSDTYL